MTRLENLIVVVSRLEIYSIVPTITVIHVQAEFVLATFVHFIRNIS